MHAMWYTSLRSHGKGFRRGVAALVLGVVAGALFLGAPAASQAQIPTNTPYDLRTEGYVALGYLANVPNVSTGISAFHLFGGGWGWFADVKHSLDDRADSDIFKADMTLEEAEFLGHPRFADESEYTSVNLGAMRAFHPEIAVYLGAGYTSRTAFRGLRDPTGELGDEGGHYFVEDDIETRQGVNAVGGIVMQAGRNLFIRLGGELFPAGVNAGVYLAMPR